MHEKHEHTGDHRYTKNTHATCSRTGGAHTHTYMHTHTPLKCALGAEPTVHPTWGGGWADRHLKTYPHLKCTHEHAELCLGAQACTQSVRTPAPQRPMHKHGHAPAHRREVLAEQCWQGHSAAPQGCRMSADIPRDAGSTGQGAQHRLSLTSNREKAHSGPSLAGDSISVTQLRDAHVQATSKPHPQGKPCRQGQLPCCNAEGAVGARIRMLVWPHHPNGPTALAPQPQHGTQPLLSWLAGAAPEQGAARQGRGWGPAPQNGSS